MFAEVQSFVKGEQSPQALRRSQPAAVPAVLLPSFRNEGQVSDIKHSSHKIPGNAVERPGPHQDGCESLSSETLTTGSGFMKFGGGCPDPSTQHRPSRNEDHAVVIQSSPHIQMWDKPGVCLWECPP
jgi:hypothetical protein